jgi:hypothetical protein
MQSIRAVFFHVGREVFAIDYLQARALKHPINAFLELRCAHSDDIYSHIRPCPYQASEQTSNKIGFRNSRASNQSSTV